VISPEEERKEAARESFPHVNSAIAIARAGTAAAETRAAKLERRVTELETEARRAYAALLEVTGAMGRPAGATAGGGWVPSAAGFAIREQFAYIAERTSGAPSLVTVVIPVYGKIDYTLRCLRSIAQSWSYSINPTIVIIDDRSPDDSVRELIGIAGVTTLCNGTNLGYLRSSNRGAAIATTPYVCFLNNDTEVQNGWLDCLVTTAESDRRIGAVGSKLVYPDGTLQEAGGIIWSDGTGWNYGRGGDPALAAYQMQRDVDYCSAASLLVRTELLREIGGFDERFAPAYYEDVDLCFAVRARGFRVVYQPKSEVIHYEGVSSGTDITSGVKSYQEVNRPKFVEKWQTTLVNHLPPSADNVEDALRHKTAQTVLVVDSYVPLHDREAGSNRLFKIVAVLRELGYHVIFFPDNGAAIEPYSSDLLRLGAEIVYAPINGLDQTKVLASVLHRVDIAWICRPELCEKYLPTVRSASTVPVVYDTIDLHFVREKLRAALEGGDDTTWRRLQDVELSMARAVDLVVTVTEVERDSLATYGIHNVAVIPTIHDVEPHLDIAFAARSGLVFIGGYSHTPNVDAALWLCKDIMPAVWRREPGMTVTLLGSSPPKSVTALRSDRVRVTGFVADVGPYFEDARLFVAPLRYGAGMKGKIGHALSFGLPIVTTSVGIDGYALTDGVSCSIADDAASFASAILKLYADEKLWTEFSHAGEAIIESLGRQAVTLRLQSLLREVGLHEVAG
jgi:GT2 family glycosyltransferase/glycosyltransferase involved in cell wall biosynthesis